MQHQYQPVLGHPQYQGNPATNPKPSSPNSRRPSLPQAPNPNVTRQEHSVRPSESVTIDRETYDRFKNLEISQATITSSMQEKIKYLEMKNDELTVQLATKESIISEMKSRKEKVPPPSPNARKYEELDALLKEERKANLLMDQHLQKLQLERTGLLEEIKALRKAFEDEESMNTVLNQRSLALVHELEILKNRPFSSEMQLDMKNSNMSLASIGGSHMSYNVDAVQELEQMHEKLESERSTHESEIQAKQNEISILLRKNQALENSHLSSTQDFKRLEQQLQDLRLQLASESAKSTSPIAEPFKNYTRNVPTGPKIVSKNPPKDFDPNIWQIYQSSDKTLAGRLDAGELEFAFTKGQWPPLSLQTCWILIRLVDSNGDFVPMEDFSKVWNFVIHCKAAFAQFDKTRKSPTAWGYVSASVFGDVLQQMGIKVPKRALQIFLKRRAQEGLS